MSAAEPPARVNVGRLLARAAAEWPERDAIVVLRPARRGGGRATFAELEARSNRIANGLRRHGVDRGQRACLLIPPGVELIATVYALFKIGAVPVIADPGMGRQALLACIAKVRPRVLVGVPRAHVARKFHPQAFASVELAVTVGARLFWGGPTLAGVEARQPATIELADTAADDPAAILFTSGSTGPPKGVVYTHGNFDAQVRALGALYRFEPGEVDLCCFPLFALFDLAFGITSVFPDLDVSRPATCDPQQIYRAAVDCGATTTFGSPAIWRRVVPWCLENAYKLEGLKRVLIAGAPVPPDLIHDFHRVLDVDGDVHTPYGATEALPVTSIDGRDVVPGLVERIHDGDGTCVGTAVPGVDVRLIRVGDEVLEEWDDDLEVGPGELGEICVRGALVTRAYAQDQAATEAAKIPCRDGSFWHRMGDVGYLDEGGRLWFCGRKDHRLRTRLGMRMPVPTENVFNVHPRVARSALVGAGAPDEELPVLVVEPTAGNMPDGEVMAQGFSMQLREIGHKHAVSADVETFLFHPAFPVDVRHNAKIQREELKTWAMEKIAQIGRIGEPRRPR